MTKSQLPLMLPLATASHQHSKAEHGGRKQPSSEEPAAGFSFRQRESRTKAPANHDKPALEGGKPLRL